MITDRAILKSGPEIQWLHMKAMINAQKGEFGISEEIFLTILQADTGNLNVKEDLANLYIEMNESEKTISLYEDLLKALPENTTILNNYAYALAQLDTNLNRAMKLSNKALKKEKSAAYCDTKAWILYRQKKYRQALIWVNKALSYPDMSAEVFYHRGRILAVLNKDQEAREAFEESLKLDPGNTEALKALEELK
jgi:tetratricopeptide (TPR) repeat protein